MLSILLWFLIREKKQPIKVGDKIQITYLPRCINARYSTNPYIGMVGTVQELTNTLFSLFTGGSWLSGVALKKVRYRILNR